MEHLKTDSNALKSLSGGMIHSDTVRDPDVYRGKCRVTNFIHTVDMVIQSHSTRHFYILTVKVKCDGMFS